MTVVVSTNEIALGDVKNVLQELTRGIPEQVPEYPVADPTIPEAPHKKVSLTEKETQLALQNALRYFPQDVHARLAPEFMKELRTYGHIFMLRYRPTSYEMRAYPIDAYPAKSRKAAAIMHMIMNNLDRRVAQFPYHLITYGGNGSVLQNWAQYHIVMKYLSQMTESQTLVMYSGHPMGLFPSSPEAPRCIVTNGMVIPNYSSQAMYDKMFALGVSQYGQMTAGSYCYIGPQGIVHGTTITIMNAGRKYLGKDNLEGVVYVSSGCGGMSGAQPKAAVISKAVAVIAEINEEPLKKRYEQGWLTHLATDLDNCIQMVREGRKNKTPMSIGYHGNVVDLWERLAHIAETEGELLVELGSDQTSLHNPYNGGYYPVQLSFEESREMMANDPAKFKETVQESLRRHVAAVNKLTAKGMRFWDYGNAFLLEASRANADIYKIPNNHEEGFKYPSYIQDIMGDIFSLGFGPFRWVCTSTNPEDLAKTDKLAAGVLDSLMDGAPQRVQDQLADNLAWVRAAGENEMVVGSQSRILYADRRARQQVALAFNEALASGDISGSIVLSRDHHDVSGTDSPYRETSNIYDGSAFCADMAIHNVIGDSFRGATWVAIHNGGGCGWGEVVNGGFGLVLDGSKDASNRAKGMLEWDVNNGVSRRAWAGNDNALFAIQRDMEANPLLHVTLPNATNVKAKDYME